MSTCVQGVPGFNKGAVDRGPRGSGFVPKEVVNQLKHAFSIGAIGCIGNGAPPEVTYGVSVLPSRNGCYNRNRRWCGWKVS